MSPPRAFGQERPRWDLFCRVVDNFGDAAIMWRLARQLATEHGCKVRLFIDQPAILHRLVPEPIDAVVVQLLGDEDTSATPDTDVIVSGFHAALPPCYRRRMTADRPVWINLEYLTAQAWIDDFHGLPSPQPDGLIQHYFYPGFSVRSGGLIREADLLDRRDRFVQDPGNARAFLAARGVTRRPDWTLASLLCYPGSPLDAMAIRLADARARLHLIVPRGAAGPIDVEHLQVLARGHLRITEVPFLAQYDYDRLLWCCDLNFVRGEDSWIRAIWSGRPFIWQIYRQAESTHLAKLEAFLRLLGSPPGAADDPLAEATRFWNDVPGSDSRSLARLVAAPSSVNSSLRGLAELPLQVDLASRLIEFAAGVRS